METPVNPLFDMEQSKIDSLGLVNGTKPFISELCESGLPDETLTTTDYAHQDESVRKIPLKLDYDSDLCSTTHDQFPTECTEACEWLSGLKTVLRAEDKVQLTGFGSKGVVAEVSSTSSQEAKVADEHLFKSPDPSEKSIVEKETDEKELQKEDSSPPKQTLPKTSAGSSTSETATSYSAADSAPRLPSSKASARSNLIQSVGFVVMITLMLCILMLCLCILVFLVISHHNNQFLHDNQNLVSDPVWCHSPKFVAANNQSANHMAMLKDKQTTKNLLAESNFTHLVYLKWSNQPGNHSGTLGRQLSHQTYVDLNHTRPVITALIQIMQEKSVLHSTSSALAKSFPLIVWKNDSEFFSPFYITDAFAASNFCLKVDCEMVDSFCPAPEFLLTRSTLPKLDITQATAVLHSFIPFTTTATTSLIVWTDKELTFFSHCPAQLQCPADGEYGATSEWGLEQSLVPDSFIEQPVLEFVFCEDQPAMNVSRLLRNLSSDMLLLRFPLSLQCSVNHSHCPTDGVVNDELGLEQLSISSTLQRQEHPFFGDWTSKSKGVSITESLYFLSVTIKSNRANEHKSKHDSDQHGEEQNSNQQDEDSTSERSPSKSPCDIKDRLFAVPSAILFLCGDMVRFIFGIPMMAWCFLVLTFFVSGCHGESGNPADSSTPLFQIVILLIALLVIVAVAIYRFLIGSQLWFELGHYLEDSEAFFLYLALFVTVIFISLFLVMFLCIFFYKLLCQVARFVWSLCVTVFFVILNRLRRFSLQRFFSFLWSKCIEAWRDKLSNTGSASLVSKHSSEDQNFAQQQSTELTNSQSIASESPVPPVGSYEPVTSETAAQRESPGVEYTPSALESHLSQSSGDASTDESAHSGNQLYANSSLSMSTEDACMGETEQKDIPLQAGESELNLAPPPTTVYEDELSPAPPPTTICDDSSQKVGGVSQNDKTTTSTCGDSHTLYNVPMTTLTHEEDGHSHSLSETQREEKPPPDSQHKTAGGVHVVAGSGGATAGTNSEQVSTQSSHERTSTSTAFESQHVHNPPLAVNNKKQFTGPLSQELDIKQPLESSAHVKRKTQRTDADHNNLSIIDTVTVTGSNNEQLQSTLIPRPPKQPPDSIPVTTKSGPTLPTPRPVNATDAVSDSSNNDSEGPSQLSVEQTSNDPPAEEECVVPPPATVTSGDHSLVVTAHSVQGTTSGQSSSEYMATTTEFSSPPALGNVQEVACQGEAKSNPTPGLNDSNGTGDDSSLSQHPDRPPTHQTPTTTPGEPTHATPTADPAHATPTADPAHVTPTADLAHATPTADLTHITPTADPTNATHTRTEDPTYATSTEDWKTHIESTVDQTNVMHIGDPTQDMPSESIPVANNSIASESEGEDEVRSKLPPTQEHCTATEHTDSVGDPPLPPEPGPPKQERFCCQVNGLPDVLSQHKETHAQHEQPSKENDEHSHEELSADVSKSDMVDLTLEGGGDERSPCDPRPDGSNARLKCDTPSSSSQVKSEHTREAPDEGGTANVPPGQWSQTDNPTGGTRHPMDLVESSSEGGQNSNAISTGCTTGYSAPPFDIEQPRLLTHSPAGSIQHGKQSDAQSTANEPQNGTPLDIVREQLPLKNDEHSHDTEVSESDMVHLKPGGGKQTDLQSTANEPTHVPPGADSSPDRFNTQSTTNPHSHFSKEKSVSPVITQDTGSDQKTFPHAPWSQNRPVQQEGTHSWVSGSFTSAESSQSHVSNDSCSDDDCCVQQDTEEFDHPHTTSDSIPSNLPVGALPRPQTAVEETRFHNQTELVVGESSCKSCHNQNGNPVCATGGVLPSANLTGYHGNSDSGRLPTHDASSDWTADGASLGFVSEGASLTAGAPDSETISSVVLQPDFLSEPLDYSEEAGGVGDGVNADASAVCDPTDNNTSTHSETHSLHLEGACPFHGASNTEHAKKDENGHIDVLSSSFITTIGHSLGASNYSTFHSLTEHQLPSVVLEDNHLVVPIQEVDEAPAPLVVQDQEVPTQEVGGAPAPPIVQDQEVLVLVDYNGEAAFFVILPHFSPDYREQFRR